MYLALCLQPPDKTCGKNCGFFEKAFHMFLVGQKGEKCSKTEFLN